MVKRKLATLFALGAGLSLLAACAIQYPKPGIKQDHVRTQLSNSITLGLPVARERTASIQLIDSAHKPQFSKQLKASITAQLQKRGFKVLRTQHGANFVLRVALKRAGIMSQTDADDILVQGYAGKIKPAGQIALGNKDYYDMAVKSQLVYGVAIDLSIFVDPSSAPYSKPTASKTNNGWYKYKTRIVSRYSNYFMPSNFPSVSSRFANSIAQAISVMF